MEYLEGHSLKQMITDKPLSNTQILEIAIQRPSTPLTSVGSSTEI